MTCGVSVFSSVSAPPPSRPPFRPPSCPPSRPPRPPHSLTPSLIHSLTQPHSLHLTHSTSLTPPHSHTLHLTHTHSTSLTHTPPHSHTLHLTHTHSTSLTHTPPHSHALTHSLTHTHSHTHSLTHSTSLTHSQCALPRDRMYALASLGSLPLLRGRRGTMCTAKGSDVRPGVPWVSASFSWQAWDNVHCQGSLGSPPLLRGRRGTMCIAKGSDVCPGSPPLLRGRCGTMCAAKGSDVRPGVPWVSASFAWQAWNNLHCQGVGCTAWRALGLRLFCVAGVAQCALPRGRMYALASLGSPPLLRRRGTMCTAKGSDVRPMRPLGLRLFCVAGVAQCALPRGRMYALASPGSPSLLRGRCGAMCTAKGSDVRPGVPWVSASFAWQAWDNVHCQGVGCTPWRPLGRLFCVGGVGQCALPRARMYALASLGSPLLLRGRRGAMCTAKGSDVRPGVPWVSASFVWQAWDNMHCQGVGCTPWRPLGVGCTPWRPLGLRLCCVAGVGQGALPRGRMALASLGSPPLLRRRGTMCTAKGSDVRPGVPSLLRGRRGTKCTAKGSDVRPGVPWVSASFVWQAWDNVHCQGSDVRPGVPWVSASFAWQAWHNVHCQGVGLRPGVPWVSVFAWQAWHNVHCQGVGCTPWRPLGLRLFCVAGVGQCALLVAFAWQAWDTVLILIHTHSFTFFTFTFFESLTHSLKSPLHSLTHPLTHSFSHPSLTQTTLTSHTHTTLTSLTHTLTHSPVHAHAYTHTLPTMTPPSPLITLPPSPLHHSYPSSSLLAFLCSV